QVILNLVGNAVKFTDEGGVLVDVSLVEKPQGSFLRIAVEDSGPGLAETDRERIFQEFEQVDGSSTRRHGGAGLGLAISKRIVEALGGDISLGDKPSRGSVFVIELPCAEERRIVQPRLTGRQILIVQASGMEAEAIGRTLVREGAAVTICASIDDVRRLKPAQFDTALIDATLEEGDLLTRIRGCGQGVGDAVTLIVSGDRGRLEALRAM
ncbi:unnamed protein product, partial [Laminaria digitata]